MVLAMYRVLSSMCMQGQMKEEYFSNSIPAQSTSKGVVIVELYLEVEDAEIESTVVNLNSRVDTVVYHHLISRAN